MDAGLRGLNRLRIRSPVPDATAELCEHLWVTDAAAPLDGPAEPGPSGISTTLGFHNGTPLPRWVWRLILAVAVSVAAFQFTMSILGKLTGLIGIVAVSLFLSFAIEPAVNYLADRGWRRGLATFACFVVLALVTLVFVFVMADLVVSQVKDLIDKAPDYLHTVSNWSNRTFNTDINTSELTKKLTDYQKDIAGVAANVGGRVLSITGSLLGTVFQGFTVLLFAFFITAEGPKFRRNICSLIPEERQRTVLLLWELAIQKTGGWIYSRMLLATASAVATWIFLTILGVPSPLALALWVGLISQFVPAIGTYLAGALPVLIALLNDPVDALWVIGFILVYQQVENYLLSPKITSQTMDLHPAVAFGAAIAGAALAGPMGAILALPAAGVLQAFISTFLERHEVIQSDLVNLERIQDTEGDSAMRSSMRRLLRLRRARAVESSGTDTLVEDADAVEGERPEGPQ